MSKIRVKKRSKLPSAAHPSIHPIWPLVAHGDLFGMKSPMTELRPTNTDLRRFLDASVASSRCRLSSGRSWRPGDRAERADQVVVGGEPVPGDLAGIHDVRQTAKHRVGEPMAAQIVPNPLDRIELRAVRRQLQQRDITGHHESLATMPAGTIEDHHGVGIGGDLAANLAEMMV